MQRFSPKFYIITLVLIGFLGYQVWQKFGHKFMQPNMTPMVSIIAIQPDKIKLDAEYNARINASQEVAIIPRVTATLIKKLYNEGDFVKKDTPLFELDKSELIEAMNKAEAGLKLAQLSFQRVQKLTKQRVVSESEFENADASFKQAEAAYQLAKINLDYAIIKAPCDGYVNSSNIDEGNIVQAHQTVITKMYKTDTLSAEFGFSDKDPLLTYVQDQKDKMQVTVLDEKTPTKALTGKISYIASNIDEKTGTIKAKATLDNAGNILKAGNFVRISLDNLAVENGIIIPDKSVIAGPMGTIVYVVTEENKVSPKPVSLGLLTKKGRIITGGLQAGDKVITEGLIKLRPDMIVEIQKPEEAPKENE